MSLVSKLIFYDVCCFSSIICQVTVSTLLRFYEYPLVVVNSLKRKQNISRNNFLPEGEKCSVMQVHCWFVLHSVLLFLCVVYSLQPGDWSDRAFNLWGYVLQDMSHSSFAVRLARVVVSPAMN